jgi:hypothetical protein
MVLLDRRRYPGPVGTSRKQEGERGPWRKYSESSPEPNLTPQTCRRPTSALSSESWEVQRRNSSQEVGIHPTWLRKTDTTYDSNDQSLSPSKFQSGLLYNPEGELMI